jgi:hypothetical protein
MVLPDVMLVICVRPGLVLDHFDIEAANVLAKSAGKFAMSSLIVDEALSREPQE